MTKDQIKYILKDICGEDINIYTRLDKCKYFTFSTAETKFCGTDTTLFYFDYDNELVFCHPARKITGSIPSSGIIINIKGTNYELLSNEDSNALVDYYPFDEISLFKMVI